MPYSKYFLADAGYVNKGTILTPFRNVKYHLKEQLGSKDPPGTPEELWNLRHASLRNEIERIFGVVKMRFPILNTGRKFPLATQFRLIHALCALHNFIRRWRTGDDMYDKLQEWAIAAKGHNKDGKMQIRGKEDAKKMQGRCKEDAKTMQRRCERRCKGDAKSRSKELPNAYIIF